MENESLAYELLSDMKKSNKRMFIVWVITFLAFLGLLTYTIWLLNDISYVEETYTQEVSDFETINGNVTNNGAIYGEDQASN